MSVNILVDSDVPNLADKSAVDVSSLAQISAWSQSFSLGEGLRMREYDAFIITPDTRVPEPSTIFLFGLDTIGATGLIREITTGRLS